MQQHVETTGKSGLAVPESDAGAARQAARGIHLAGIGKSAQAVQKHSANGDGKRGVNGLLPPGVHPARRLGITVEVVHCAMPK